METKNTQTGFIIAKVVELSNKEKNSAGLYPVRYDAIYGGYTLKRVEDGTFAEDCLKLEVGRIYLLQWTELPPKDADDLEMYGNRVIYSNLADVSDDIKSPKMHAEWKDWLGMAEEIPMLVPPPEKEEKPVKKVK